MDLRLLGPVEAELAGRRVDLGRRQERLVLAVLGLSAGRPVSIDRLAELLWDGEVPPSGRSALYATVSRLRASLDGIRIARGPAGYQLDLDPERVDAHRFRRLVEQARSTPDGAERVRLLGEALLLWRGPALADVGSARLRERLCGELEELRIWAVEQRVEGRLALGMHEALVSELTELLAEPPVSEPITGYLMIALYRCGRQADALEVYRRTRRRLADELGLDPGSELRRIERAVLTGDPDLDRVPAARPGDVPRQLPPDLVPFVGRTAEIDAIRAALDAPASPRMAVTIAIHGPGGIGKSALAVHVAHRLADRFPDGQLYIDLHGTTHGLSPVHPADATGRFLRALGVPPRDVPVDADEAAGSYRSMLAGRRTLVLLDNAVDAAQVRPLLLAGAGCVVVVTSRRRLSTVDARHFDLERLSPAEAVALLEQVTGGDRVPADPGLAADIVARCDWLPLAVRIVGARLAALPDLSLREVADRLHDERRRLDELAEDDLAVRTCFDGSYQELLERDPQAAAMFRRLGVLAVPSVGVQVAAALLDGPSAEAAAALDRLVEARLVESVAEQRFRLHDLLRLFAMERAAADDGEPGVRRAALHRALSCYLDAARAAAAFHRPDSMPDSGPGFGVPFPARIQLDSRAAAVAWVDAEIAGLIAAARQASTEPGPVNRFAVHLDAALGNMLAGLARWRDVEGVGTAAVAAAERAGDHAAQAYALSSVGSAYIMTKRLPEAIATLERAVALTVADGDLRGEANSLDHLGWAHYAAGDYARAQACVARGLELRTQAGNRHGQAISHNNLADILVALGRPEEALPHLEASLQIHRTNGDRVGEAYGLANVGRCMVLLHRDEDATAVLDEAVAACRESTNRQEEWRALIVRNVARRRTGRYDLARDDCLQAIEVCRTIGDGYGEARCLDQLGRATQLAGDERGAEHRRLAARLRSKVDATPDPSLEAVLGL